MYPKYQQSESIRVEETFFTMSDGIRLYTRILLPAGFKRCPVVFQRTPYEASHNGEAHPLENCENDMFVKNGYAVILQHCRGRGDSEGDCVPYGNAERTDALETLELIRKLPFYNGEIYLFGGSYLSTVHLLYLDPTPADIKGAALSIQTDRMYFRNYRNGCCYDFCNVNWYKSMLSRRYPNASTEGKLVRPFKDIAKRVFSEDIPELTGMYLNDTYNEFWKNDPRTNVMEHLTVPILLTEGWYDFYIEGMFSMWERLNKETKAKYPFVVGPWGHATQVNNAEYPLPHGNIPQDFPVKWFNSIRTQTPYEYAQCGKVNYYSIGGDRWTAAEEPQNLKTKRFYMNADQTLSDQPMQAGQLSYRYNPDFRHGKFQYHNIYKTETADAEDGIISFYGSPFEKDTSFYGNVRWHATVRSDCEDTAFFIRIYLTENGCDYNLTETITTLSHVNGNYTPGTETCIDLQTPPIAFTVKKGCGIRVDISSDGGIYVPHANVKRHWAEVTETQTATNTLILGKETFIEISGV